MNEQYQEEQEMEQEALAAIFMDDFVALNEEQPYKWSIMLEPIQDDPDANHVGLKLIVDIPLTYPEEHPELNIEITKGLAEDQIEEIFNVAKEEVDANEGMPCLFSVCEAVRGWLLDNNKEFDGSMYAQMMRKQDAMKKSNESKEYESYSTKTGPSQTEIEEAAVHKRRAEGTPCNQETFNEWKRKFESEMKELEECANESNNKKKEKNAIDYSTRKTGYEIFGSKTGVLDLEAMEAAADLEGKATLNLDDVDEDLFGEDEDLDELDFDSDEDDFDDGSDEEPDI